MTHPLRTVFTAVVVGALLASCAATSTPARVLQPPLPSVVANTPAAVQASVHTALGAPPSAYVGRVSAFGDSVMVGAAPRLVRAMRAAVYAQVGRQSPSLLKLLRIQYRKGLVRGPVVIHTGTNGSISRAELESTIRPIQAHRLVVLINVKANRRWAAADNRILAAVAARYINVVLLDWARLGRAHPGWFYRDGIHLKPAGQAAYVAAVRKLLHR